MGRTWICPDCGVAMTEQPRTPAGVPTGGQFAALARGEAGVALKPLDGSFMFPPPMRTADEIIDFWSRVEIPDEVLARTRLVFRENREMLKTDWPHHAWDWDEAWRWGEQNPQPDPSDAGAFADWEGRQRVAQDQYENAMRVRLQDLPEELERADIRPLFRASAMMRTAMDLDHLPFEDQRRIQDHVMQFATGPRRVGDVTVETGMAGLAHRFVYPDNYDKDGDGVIDPPTTPSLAMSADFDWDRHKQIVNEAVQNAIGEHEQKLDEALNEIYSGITADIALANEANLTAMDPRKPRKVRWSER